MTKRKRPDMKTTVKAIVNWMKENIDDCGWPVDPASMHSHCSRCGHKRGDLERAHIVPWAKYDYDPKYDSPEYYRLLCSDCHAEAPNVMDEKAMDAWIREAVLISGGVLDYYWDARKALQEIIDQTGQHGFDSMNSATKGWCVERFKLWEKEDRRKTLELANEGKEND